jgi:hypothetical protein
MSGLRENQAPSGGFRRFGRAAAAVLAGCLAASAPGCRKSAPPAPPKNDPQTRRKAETPTTVPGLAEAGLAEELPGEADLMVKGAYDRVERETYTYDPKHPAGTIKGSARFVDADGLTCPPPPPVELTGPAGIQKPLPKELDYYKTVGLTRPMWYIQHGRGKHAWHQPTNVVLRLGDVKVGRRPPLRRPILVVGEGRIGPGDDANHGRYNVQFAPLHERAQFTTWDQFPSQIVLTRRHAGQPVFQQTVRYAHGKVGTRNEAGHLAYRPEFVITTPIREPGLYVVTDRRHPWIEGYLFVVDNPYVAVTWGRRGKVHTFTILNVPPGKHTLDVWHPVFEPVQRTHEVHVEANKITELLVELRPPAAWRRPET